MDRTEDEIFNEHLQNFSKQQNSANKLQKEFNNYIRCVRGKFPTNSTCIYIVAGFFFGFIEDSVNLTMTLILYKRTLYYYY